MLFQKQPDFDNAAYPIEEIDEDKDVLFSFENYGEMVNRCNKLLDNPTLLEEKRVKCYENAIKYFSVEPIARYFLLSIL